jgi:hypothetical protein
MIDDGHAVHYTAVERGTPIYSSDEVEVGVVEEVVDNYREHIFDGIVMRDGRGEFRFVDAPEVKRTAERAVTLTITAEAVEELPPPDPGGYAEFEPRRGAGKVARKLGFGWKKRR